jgi:excisionase family DNA binding protein
MLQGQISNIPKPHLVVLGVSLSQSPTAAPLVLAYSKADTAKILSVSTRTIDNLIAQKELTVRRVGRRVIVPLTSIQALLRGDSYTAAKAA